MKKGTANKKEANGSHFGGKICYLNKGSNYFYIIIYNT